MHEKTPQPVNKTPPTELAHRVQIYIAAYERPDYLRETLSSALAQEEQGIQIVVSDNSLSDGVQKMMANEFPQVEYIRRRPAVSSCEHGRLIFRESSAEFLIYFHDDDLMTPGYVKSLLAVMDEHPELVAVACDAWTLHNDVPIRQRRMGDFAEPLILRRVEDLLKVYLDFNQIRLPAPYPSYLYRRRMIEGLSDAYPEIGKFTDVAVIMKALERGPVMWLPEPLILYREHSSNDSATESVGHRLKLLRHIYRNSSILPHDPSVEAYRFRYWLNWWIKGKWQNKRTTPWREKVVLGFLIRNFIRFTLTHRGFRQKFLAKVLRVLHIAREKEGQGSFPTQSR